MGFAEYFDRNASRFSRLYHSQPVTRALGRGALFDRLNFAVEVAEREGAGHVLDIGCGSGVLFEPLGTRKIRVTAIDPAPAMVELARAAAKPFGDLIRVEERAWESVGPGDTADLAVALGVFDYVDKPSELLGRMAMAAPSAVASFPSKGLRTLLRKFRYGRRGVSVFGYDRRDIEELARDAGVTIAELRPLAQAGFAVHFRRAG